MQNANFSSMKDSLVHVDDHYVPYFFAYMTEFFPSKTIPKIQICLMTDLDLWNCLGRIKLVLRYNKIS